MIRSSTLTLPEDFKFLEPPTKIKKIPDTEPPTLNRLTAPETPPRQTALEVCKFLILYLDVDSNIKIDEYRNPERSDLMMKSTDNELNSFGDQPVTTA